MSALDHLLANIHRGHDCEWPGEVGIVDAAKAELAALRERCSDLELIVRADGHTWAKNGNTDERVCLVYVRDPTAGTHPHFRVHLDRALILEMSVRDYLRKALA